MSMSFFMAMYEKARIVRWLYEFLTVIMLAAVIVSKSYSAIIVGVICVVAWLVLVRRRQLVRPLRLFVLIGGTAR
jgi:dolichol kinase